MITTVTLNPAIDREYFVKEHKPGENNYIYKKENMKISPGGKGLMAAIDLKKLGYNKLLGAGKTAIKYEITVDVATPSAIKKIQEAGGKVVVKQAKEEQKPNQE